MKNGQFIPDNHHNARPSNKYAFRISYKHSDTQARANSTDPDQTPQHAASDQGLFYSHPGVLRHVKLVVSCKLFKF